MLQILITVWVRVHPLTYTIPHKYSGFDNACKERIEQLAKRVRKGSYKRMQFECVQAMSADA